MVAADQITITCQACEFTHEDACRLCEVTRSGYTAQRIVLDLRNSADTSTAAFARLILLRRQLLHAGRDLCLAGLHDRVAALYEINRLGLVLPLFSTGDHDAGHAPGVELAAAM